MAKPKPTPAPALDPTDHAGIAHAALARLHAGDTKAVDVGASSLQWEQDGDTWVLHHLRPDGIATLLTVGNRLAVRGELVQAAIAGALG